MHSPRAKIRARPSDPASDRSDTLNVMVTGGAGFIGSALCRHLVETGRYRVTNVDKLTYSGSLQTLKSLEAHPRYRFFRTDIGNSRDIAAILRSERIDAIVHLAAETHVDRSIDGPGVFLQTNVMGTFGLLEAALFYWRELDVEVRAGFRFHHVSTDEVFGDLPLDGGSFSEASPYRPSSPYAASKAASDHLVRAWHKTYGLPVILSNSSNNFGPFQYPEKLIPLMIVNAVRGMSLPIYGDGKNVRDWLFVDDHARALERILRSGRVGESYNVGGRSEWSNRRVVETICDLMDHRRLVGNGRSHRNLIRFVTDRPGHDLRYALDCCKIEQALGWVPDESFESGLARTVDWYLENEWWWRPLVDEPGGREEASDLATAVIVDTGSLPPAGPAQAGDDAER